MFPRITPKSLTLELMVVIILIFLFCLLESTWIPRYDAVDSFIGILYSVMSGGPWKTVWEKCSLVLIWIDF